jgi:hypothetical protein
MKETAFSQLGAVLAVLFYVSAIAVFVFRLVDRPHWGQAAGIFELCLALPLVFMLVKASAFGRPALFYVQIVLMLAWLAAELVLDYILKLDFRQIRWAVISYVVFFFAASGGLLGVASYAGRGWTVASVILFLTVAALAFIQRFVTSI